MNKIIVTITDAEKTCFFDVEIPTEVRADKLKIDIAEALNGLEPNLYLNARDMKVYCNRIRRVLDYDETAESAGVRNGDYITVTRRF